MPARASAQAGDPVWASSARELEEVSHRPRKGTRMGLDDKTANKAQELKGEAKEGVGRATDDEELQAEGQADQAKGNLKQAGEKVKDAFKD